jgi:winged helix DNA-binding protein
VKIVIPEHRLHNQRITRAVHRQPADVVAWLGAVQAQEYPAARWGLALRMPPGTTDAEIERAVNEGRILRTHVMRPTWHFVTPADIHWMLELTAPRVHRAMSYYRRQHGLETAILTRATAAFERALRDGQCLTRTELGAQLERCGLVTKVAKGIPLALLTIYAELEGVICSGPRRGKQLTYALLPARAPRTPRLSRDEALAELTRRYFRSHGPATIRDFTWWSGLATADAKRGLEMNKARDEVVDGRTYWTIGRTPAVATARGTVHLLPVYDEYLVAYRDRDAVPHPASTIRSGSRGTVTFQHALVIAGQVAGTWKPGRKASGVVVDVIPLRPLTRPERRGLDETAARYGRFLDVPVSLSIV